MERRAGKRLIESLARAAYGKQADGARVVIAGDYLGSRLDAINRRMLRDHQPWVLARAGRDAVWIGPLFVPGKTACWRCVADRVRSNSPVLAYLHESPAARRVRKRNETASAPVAKRMLRLLRGRTALKPATVLVFDPVRNALDVYPVERRPQCPACGDASSRAMRGIVAAKRFLANPVGGITSGLTRVRGPFHIVVASPIRMGALETHEQLLATLQARPAGSGDTWRAAEIAALGETIERHSQVWQGDEPRVRSTLKQMGPRAIDPTGVMLFSETQYRTRSRHNAVRDPVRHVPRPFRASAMIDWTPVRSLSGNEERCLPTAMLYFGAESVGADMFTADSNGCAAGETYDDAVVRGFLELVERDSVALWWYNRAIRPAVALPAEHRRLAQTYKRLGRDLVLLDLTSDLRIPVVAAISRRSTGGHEVFGFGAHFDAGQATTRALMELNQVVGSLATIRDEDMNAVLPRTFASWLSAGGDRSWVAGDKSAIPATHRLSPLTYHPSPVTVPSCVRVARRAGLEVFALDLTRRDIGIPVVKVIVPGLRPAVARFAPGRLFDVPPAIGWQRHRLREHQLNPTPFFL